MEADEQEALNNYIVAKQYADSANSVLAETEQQLLKVMEAHKHKTIGLQSEGKKFSATYTQRTSLTVNEQGLRKALTARVFDKYTVKKLDRKALEDAMKDGTIDPMVVAQYVEPQPGKTYITYRVKEEDEEATGS